MRLLLLGLVLAACAPRNPHLEYALDPTDEGDDPRAQPAPSGAPGAPAEAPAAAAPVVRRRGGTIARAELAAVIDRGPAAFLSRVEVRPSFVARRFRGWEIVAFYPDDPRYAAVDLLPGDVVTHVNGRAIERPEQFQDVWESLRFATTLTVDYLRGAEARQLTYRITP